MLRLPAKRKGLTLMEVLVVTALMSAISAFTIVIYKTALGDYESSTMQTSMVKHARKVSQKIAAILSTAVNRTEAEQAFADTTKSPPQTGALGAGDYPSTEVNFLSTANYIKNSVTECAYAFDDGEATPGYTSVFRYRLAWTGTQIGKMPPNSVYLERRTLPVNLSGVPLDSTGIFQAGSYRQSLGNNIGDLRFQLVFGNTMQVKVTVYSIDPITGRNLEGLVMRKMVRSVKQNSYRTDAATGMVKSYELRTSVPIPTVSIKT